MFVIANENGPMGEDRICYELFGIKLMPEYDIRQTLEWLRKTSMLDDQNSLLNKVLRIDNNKNVYTKTSDPKGSFDLNLDWELIKELGLVLQSIRNQDTYMGFEYNELITTARRFFEIVAEKEEKYARKLDISLNLYDALTTLHTLDFKIIRTTEKREVRGHPRISASNGYGNISLAKYNSLILMLLSGKTTYMDNGIETPIIVDGVLRRPYNWQLSKKITIEGLNEPETNGNRGLRLLPKFMK